jgi:hypothetical protein
MNRADRSQPSKQRHVRHVFLPKGVILGVPGAPQPAGGIVALLGRIYLAANEVRLPDSARPMYCVRKPRVFSAVDRMRLQSAVSRFHPIARAPWCATIYRW